MDRVVEHYEGLEATTDNLGRLLGPAVFRELVKAFGGRNLYVPRAPGPSHPLTVAIGQDGADQLAAAFHGVEIAIPMAPNTRAEILRLAAIPWTRTRIARHLHVTERWVYRTLAESDDLAPRAPDLFG